VCIESKYGIRGVESMDIVVKHMMTVCIDDTDSNGQLVVCEQFARKP
jgi:hypothetical protein